MCPTFLNLGIRKTRPRIDSVGNQRLALFVATELTGQFREGVFDEIDAGESDEGPDRQERCQEVCAGEDQYLRVEPGIELLTGTTGIIQDTYIFTDLATIDAATVADGMAHFEVYYVEVGNEAGTIVKTPSVDD